MHSSCLPHCYSIYHYLFNSLNFHWFLLDYLSIWILPPKLLCYYETQNKHPTWSQMYYTLFTCNLCYNCLNYFIILERVTFFCRKSMFFVLYFTYYYYCEVEDKWFNVPFRNTWQMVTTSMSLFFSSQAWNPAPSLDQNFEY